MFKYLLSFVLLVDACKGSQQNGSANYTDIKARLDKGSIALSGQFIHQLSQSRPDDNFVTSATSILVPLAQIALFGQAELLQEILEVLKLSNKNEIKTAFKQETANYKYQQNVEFEIATEYYVNENYELSDRFKRDSQKYFDASGENIDFDDNEQAADTINDWVANKTHDRIQNLVSADSLGPSTVVVLVNAIYFLGNWVHQFNPNNTEKRDFTKSNGDVVQLETMYQENTFNYAENIQGLNVQALEMPYKNENFSCLLVLPEEGYYEETIEALVNPDAFDRIIDSLRSSKVQVYMPKMLINTNMDMAEMLQKANVTQIFNPNSDGLKCILKSNQKLYVSSAVQKAFLRCDETGTEAAAATALGISLTSIIMEPTQVYIFNARRSYLFYILYQRVPMFGGAFVGAP